MSKFSASGGGTPPPPRRENPGLDRISIFRGCLLIKRAMTIFKREGRGRCSFYTKNTLKVRDIFFSVIIKNLN